MNAEYSDAFEPLPLLNDAVATMVPDEHSLNAFEGNGGGGFSLNGNDLGDLDSLSVFDYESQDEMDFDEKRHNDDGLQNIEPIDIQHDEPRYSYYGASKASSSTIEPRYGAEGQPMYHHRHAAEDLVSDLPQKMSSTATLPLQGNYRNYRSCPSETGSSVTGEPTYDMHSMNESSCNRSNRSAPLGVANPQGGSNFYSFYRYSEPSEMRPHAADQSWERQTAQSAQSYPANVHGASWVGGNNNSWQGGQQPHQNSYGTAKSSLGISLLNKNFNAMNCVSENEPSFASCPEQNILNHLEPTTSAGAGAGASRFYSYYNMTGEMSAEPSQQYAAVPAPSGSARATSYQGAHDEHTGGRRSGSLHLKRKSLPASNNFDTVSCESMPVNLPSFSTWKDNSLSMAYEEHPGTETMGSKIKAGELASFNNHTAERRRLSISHDTFGDTRSSASMPAAIPSVHTSQMNNKSEELDSFYSHTAIERSCLSSSSQDIFDTLSSASMPASIPSVHTSICDNATVPSKSPSAKSEKLDEESPEKETGTRPYKKQKPIRKQSRSRRPSVRAKKTSLLEASLAENDWHRERTRIVKSGDTEHATRFTHGVLREYCSTTFQVKDRQGKRNGLSYGFPGLSCYHCNGGDKVGGRYFPSTIKTMSDTNKTLMSIFKHLNKCKKCPKKIQQRLQRLHLTHEDERKKQSYGSQKAFFTIVWKRLHKPDEENVLDDTDEENVLDDTDEENVLDDTDEENVLDDTDEENVLDDNYAEL